MARVNRNSGVLVVAVTLGSSAGICLILLGVVAQLLLFEKVGEGSTIWLAVAAVLIGTFSGNAIGVKVNKEYGILTTAIHTVCILLLVFLSGLAFDGKFQNVIALMGSVLAGGGLACAVCMKKTRKYQKGKRRNR